MKFKLIFFLAILFQYNAFSQNLLDKLSDQAVTIDSLKNRVVKPLSDSLLNINKHHSNEINKFSNELKKLQKQISLFESEKKDLEKTIQKLNHRIEDLEKNKLKIERDKLLSAKDSLIGETNKILKLLDSNQKLLEEQKSNSEKLAIQEKENGKKEVQNQIASIYLKPIDELIEINTIYTLERDQAFIEKNNDLQKKIDILKTYFIAERVLTKQYNKENVSNSIQELSKIEKTDLINKLLLRINNYSEVREGLLLTIEKIVKLEDKLVANDPYTKKEKLKEILAEFAWYYRNYQFEFSDYPYLASIIIEINKIKQKDPNADIQSYKEKI